MYVCMYVYETDVMDGFSVVGYFSSGPDLTSHSESARKMMRARALNSEYGPTDDKTLKTEGFDYGGHVLFINTYINTHTCMHMYVSMYVWRYVCMYE